MRPWHPVLALLVACLVLPLVLAAEETIPPLYRAERHFTAGEKYLKDLPENSRITLNRTDGTLLDLDLKGGKLGAALPPSRLSEDGRTLATPLGFRIVIAEKAADGVRIDPPSGFSTTFVLFKKWLVAREGTPRLWSYPANEAVLRLTDGTRIDFPDGGNGWEVLTLLGERFSLDQAARTWSALPALPSPPLIPTLPHLFPATGGGVWRIATEEDRLVLAWNWFPIGLELTRAIDEVRGGPRRNSLDRYFNTLAQPQPAPEMAACLLTPRFGLQVGDQVTFSIPGREPETVVLLPGVPEGSFAEPKISPQLTKLPGLATSDVVPAPKGPPVLPP